MQGKQGVCRNTIMILCWLTLSWSGIGAGISSSAAQSYEAEPLFELTGPQTIVREGYFRLTAEPGENSQGNEPFIVQMSGDEDFSAIRATFPPLGNFNRLSLSGFDDGVYYFRLSSPADNSILSNSIRVEVRHYPLSRALGLFGLGAALFTILLILIIRFWWRDSYCRTRCSNRNTDGGTTDG